MKIWKRSFLIRNNGAIKFSKSDPYINWQDLPTEIKKIAAFLGKTLTEEQIGKLVDHVRMDKFSKNESVNMDREIKAGLANEGYTFVRKGKLRFEIFYRIFPLLGHLNLAYLFRKIYFYFIYRCDWRLEESFQPGIEPENWRMDWEESCRNRLEICYWTWKSVKGIIKLCLFLLHTLKPCVLLKRQHWIKGFNLNVKTRIK